MICYRASFLEDKGNYSVLEVSIASVAAVVYWGMVVESRVGGEEGGCEVAKDQAIRTGSRE